MRKILPLLLVVIGTLTLAEQEPAARLGKARPIENAQQQPTTPSAGRPAAVLGKARPAHGTERFQTEKQTDFAINREEGVCTADISKLVDDQLLNNLMGVMISPSQFHSGGAAMARDFLRDAASRDPQLANRILEFATSAYKYSQLQLPGAETGDLLQLRSEIAEFLPVGHPMRTPGEMVTQLRKHALDWVDASLANPALARANKGLLKGTQLAPGLINIVAGYASALDRITNENERAEALQSFIDALKARGITEAQGYLLQPLARHFSPRQFEKLLTDWKSARYSTSTISLVATIMAEHRDPKIADLGSNFLRLSNSDGMKDIKAAVDAGLAKEKKGIEDNAKLMRGLNGEIMKLSVELGLTAAAIIDPSPVCSALNAGYCVYSELKKDDPDYIAVSLSLVGMLPLLGKLSLGASLTSKIVKLRNFTLQAKAILDVIMASRRMLQQSKTASGFLDHALAVAGATLDNKLYQQAEKIPMPARIALESFTGLPLSSKNEPIAAAFLKEAVNETRFGKRFRDGCAAFDKRLSKVKDLLLAPGRKLIEAINGKQPSLMEPQQAQTVADRMGQLDPFYNYDLQTQLEAAAAKFR